MLIQKFKYPHWCILLGIFFCISSCDSSIQKEEKSIETSSVKVEDQSLTDINQRLKNDPSNTDLYLQRAQYFLLKNNKKEALDDIDRVIEIDSNISKAYRLRADVHFMNRQTRDARADYQKAIEKDPKDIESHLKLAEIFMLLEKYPESISWVNKALKIDVFNPSAYFQKGMTFKYGGDTASAISSFQTCVEQDPKYTKAYIQLGRLNERINPLFALQYYNNAIQATPSSLEAIYHKSYFLHHIMNRPKQALEGYKLMLEIDPKNYNALFSMGHAYMEKLHKPDSALLFFNQASTLYPSDYKTMHNMGLCYEDLKQFEQAKAFYEKALEIKPDYEKSARRLSGL